MADQNNMADNRFAVNLEGSPFAAYLQGYQPPPGQQQERQKPSGVESKAGGIAYFLDQFIRGAQAGSYRKQQMELAKEQQSDQAVNQYLQLLQGKDPVAAKKLEQDIVTERGKKAMSFLEGADKGKGGNPVLKAMKALGEGVLGGPVKKWDGYGDKMGDWAQQILTMPSKEDAYKRDIGIFNQIVQGRINQIKGGDPNKVVYMEDIANDPAMRTAASQIQSYYGINPMAGWERDVNSNRAKSPEQLEAERATARAQTARAEQDIKDIRLINTPPPESPAGPGKPRLFATEVSQGPSATGADVLPAATEQALRRQKSLDYTTMTVGGREGQQVKRVTQGPLAGNVYDMSNNRISPDRLTGREIRVPESEQRLDKPRVEAGNKELEAMWKAEAPGEPFPDYMRLPEDATKQDAKDYQAHLKDFLNVRRQQAQFNEMMRRDTERDKTEGTWVLEEAGDGSGKMLERNTKTDQIRPAQTIPRGTFTKQVEPYEQARKAADDYLGSGVYTGPGDNMLREQFFQATMPLRGFRMTQAQIKAVENAQSLMNRAWAMWGSLTKGTLYSPELREQMVHTIDSVVADKLLFLNQASRVETQPPPTAQQPPPVTPPARPAQIPQPQTQAEYNSLPPGTVFIGKDGKQYRKK